MRYWWKNRQIDSSDKNRINKQNNIDAVNWLLTKERKQHSGAERVFQQMVLEQLDTHMRKNEPRLISYTPQKNYLETDHRLECKMQNYKIPKR